LSSAGELAANLADLLPTLGVETPDGALPVDEENAVLERAGVGRRASRPGRPGDRSPAADGRDGLDDAQHGQRRAQGCLSERPGILIVFVRLNSALRWQRRRLLVLATVFSLAGVVVVAHTVANHDHMGDAIVICIAVVETAAVAAVAAIALGLFAARPAWWVAPPLAGVNVRAGATLVPVAARAGPVVLQVFRR
jgi:hypothetical protein